MNLINLKADISIKNQLEKYFVFPLSTLLNFILSHIFFQSSDFYKEIKTYLKIISSFHISDKINRKIFSKL